MQVWILIVALLATGVVSPSSDKNLVKGQISPILTTRIGSNGETILVVNGADCVTLTGATAKMVHVPPDAPVTFNTNNGDVTAGDLVFPGKMKYTQQICGTQGAEGPGKLFLDDKYCYFVTKNCADVLSFITTAIANATHPPVNLTVNAETDGGQPVSVLDLNDGEFTITLTGANAIQVSASQSVWYSNGILTVNGQSFSVASCLGVSTVDGYLQASIFDATDNVHISGPGTLYVQGNKAAFIESQQAASINIAVAQQSFVFNEVTPGIVTVSGAGGNQVTILSNCTKKFNIPAGASSVSYVATGPGTAGTVYFRTSGGRVIEIPGVEQFSIFDNNELITLSQGDMNVPICGGGTVCSDTLENTVLFVSDTNPATHGVIREFTPPPKEDLSPFTIETGSEGVRILTGTVDSMPVDVQTITGSYVTGVSSSETVVYRDNEVVINNFDGTPKKRIGHMKTFVTDTGRFSSMSFNTTAPVTSFGPGTLSCNLKTAFFTNDQSLGQQISTASATAPVPNIDFETSVIGENVIEGVPYEIRRVTQIVGGTPVVHYEASCYYTSPDQELLYSGNITVHRPITTGSGNVAFNGGAQTVTYTDTNGNPQDLTGVGTFYDFSGGNVQETNSPDNSVIQGPGKLYVSEDGSEVLFTSSHIITPEVAEIIRRGQTDVTINADQLSTIINGKFRVFTELSKVRFPGGGVIYYSSADNGTTTQALYVNDEGALSTIKRVVGAALLFTKSVPSKDDGIIRIIFNGRVIYAYSPTSGSRAVPISSTGSFTFDGTALTGPDLPDGPYPGITSVTAFDGVCVTTFNSSTAPLDFLGPGLLLVQPDSSEAFYTTSQPTVDYLLQSIAILKQFLSPPQLLVGEGRITTKQRAVTVSMGTDVTAYEGADISFECKVLSGRPEPNVTFFRVVPNFDDIPINASDALGIIIENNTLTLLDVLMLDNGEFKCVASNGVEPDATASSTLRVRQAVAPVLRPGWFPFHLSTGQKVLFPDVTVPPPEVTIDLREFDELIFACRVDGKPKGLVRWLVDDVPIDDTGLPYDVVEIVPGRSVLIFDLKNMFNMTMFNGLLGRNQITCESDNTAASLTRGDIILNGEIIDCPGPTVMGSCPATCGYGLQDYVYACERFTDDGMSVPIDIDDVPFRVVPQIMRQRECTARDGDDIVICPIVEFIWNVSDWSACSQTCNGGFQTRIVACQSRTVPITSKYIADLNGVTFASAEITMCAMSAEAGVRPADRRLCEEQDCPYYRTSQFGECSVTCGTGVRERTVECVVLENTYLDMNGKTQFNETVLNDTACDPADIPSDSIVCNDFPCFFEWQPQEFGACGPLFLDLPPDVAMEFPFCRERAVVCINEMGVIFNDTYCSDKPRPTTLSSCGGGRCFEGIWEALPWGACSATCGYGLQSREVRCFSPDSLRLVPTDYCDVATKPVTERHCFLRNCDTCLRDESPICPLLAANMMCGFQAAMGVSGLRCCVTCMGMTGGD